MAYENHYSITPLVVSSDAETCITIRALYPHASWQGRGELHVRYMRDDGFLPDGRLSDIKKKEYVRVPAKITDDSVDFSFRFAGECEHSFQLVLVNGEKEEVLTAARIYSLEADLFRLRPFKGDFHMHSNRSDGTECPEYMAACARRTGFDFMAVTDHDLYNPSLDAIKFIESTPCGMRCYPGEEVQPPGCRVHVVNFGSSSSISGAFAGKDYRRDIEARQKEFQHLPPEARLELASAEWCFDAIRKNGGIAVYPHPHWKKADRYVISSQAAQALLQRHKFDALEVIGGFGVADWESHALTMSIYHQLQSEGHKIPAVALSDSHDCNPEITFGEVYTVVLAKSADFSELAEGIRSFHSVAVKAMPKGFPQIIGPHRLVKYVHFLLREFYPRHDRLCRVEGELLLEHLAGDKDALTQLAAHKGKVAAFLNFCRGN